MSTERIDIVIREEGSRVVNRNIKQIGTTGEESAKGIDLLKSALAGMLAFLAVEKVREYADAWNSAAGLIAVATKNTADAAAITERLYKGAQKTRGSFNDLVDIYAAASRASNNLGASQEKMLQFTQGIGTALAVQHTTATRASGAMLELGQLLDSGQVYARQFRSVMMQTPVILQTVARGLGDTTGSITKLREKMLAGTLTSHEFFQGFLRGLPHLEEEFKKSAFTIGQGLQIIHDSFEKFIGQLYESTGASEAYAKAARLISNNMQQIGAVLLSVGAAFAAVFAVGLVIKFTVALRALFVLINTNPFIALATAIVGVVTYLSLYGDKINAGIDATTTMKDVLVAFERDAVAAFHAVVQAAQQLADGLVSAFAGASTQLVHGTANTTDRMSNSYSDFFATSHTGFAAMLINAAKTIDAIAGLLTGLGIAFYRVFSGIPALVGNAFRDAYNNVVGWIEKMVNATINGVNKLRTALGREAIKQVQLARAQVSKGYGKAYVANIKSAFDEGFAVQGGFLENYVNGLLSRAQKIAAARKKSAGSGSGVDLNAMPGGGSGGIDPKELAKLQKQLDRLVGSYDKVAAAQLEVTKAAQLLDTAQKAGLITGKRRGELLQMITAQLADQLNPMGAIIKQLDRQQALLGLVGDKRQVETQLMQIEDQLKQEGIQVTAKEILQLREKLTLIQEETRVSQAKDQIYSQLIGQQQTFTAQVTALNQLVKDKTVTQAQADQYLLQSQSSLLQGTQEGMQAMVQAHQDAYNRINALRQNDLISEQTAAQAKRRADLTLTEARLQNQRSFYSALSSLSSSGNRKLAAIGKAAAVTQATIDGVLAVQKALASAPPPINYAMAAAVGIEAAANVAQILSQNTAGFEHGGNFTVGGSGGADSQLVAFRATPGERVHINTPGQARALEQGGQQAAPQVHQKIVNVLDPSIVGDYLSTEDGEQLLVNVLHKNGIQRSNA